jgi:1,2-phenylacetyl-CoA epoxidase catalytic subunit
MRDILERLRAAIDWFGAVRWWDCANKTFGGDSPASLLGAAADEIERLRADLQEQWEWNHAEHCTNMTYDDRDHNCHWPKPVSLGGEPGIHRAYDVAPLPSA